MTKKLHYKKGMKECPYCGNEEFYVKQSYSGVCYYNMRIDGGQAGWNGDMYDYATHKDLTKYAYCNNCEKRLCPMDEFYKSLFI